MSNTYHWIGNASTFGIFDAAGNWYDDTTGAAGASAPSASDTANLAGAGTIVGAGSVACLNVEDTTSNGFTFIGTGTDITATQVSVTGSLDLTEQATLLASTLSVNGASSPSVLSLAGGTLTHAGEALDLSVTGTTAGEAQQGSAIYLFSNQPGLQTLLDIGSGTAQIGVGSGQSGLVEVTGGAMFTGSAGSAIELGTSGANGQLSVFSGTVSTAGSLVIGDVGTGVLTLQNGTLSVGDGTGSALVLGDETPDTTGVVALVNASYSTMTLDGQALIGNTGSADLNASAGVLTTLDGLDLGVSAVALGVMSLSQGEAWTDTGEVIVGDAGQGSLTLSGTGSAGPTSTINGNLVLGASSGSGTIAISGVALTVKGATILEADGRINSITVAQGGTLNSAGETISLLANADTGLNALSVTGSGSVLDAGALFIGANNGVDFGDATMGTIGTSLSTTAVNIQGSLDLGNADISVTGAVVISGGPGAHGLILGGTLTIDASTTALIVGQAGHVSSAGDLTAHGGISLTGPSTTLEIDSGIVAAVGSVGPALEMSNGATLSIDGGTLNTSGQMSVGGELDIDGGSITSTSIQEGAAAVIISGGMATISPSGAGGIWSVTGDMDVGGAQSGELLFSRGGGLAIDGTLRIGTDASTGTVSDSFGNGSVDITGSNLNTATSGGIEATGLAMTGADSTLSAGTLIVGTATTGAAVSMAGGTISATTTITIDHGSRIHGGGTLQAPDIVDLGRIQVNHSTLTCLGSVTGTGQLDVKRGDMVLSQGEAAGVGLVFGGFGTFTVGTVSSIVGTLSGWGRGDAIDFTGASIASLQFAGHTLSLFAAGGSLVGTETFAGAYAGHNFSLSPDTGAGTLLTYHP